MKPSTDHLGKGFVTFLDILGWKGVYARQDNAIDALTGIVEDARKRTNQMRGLTVSGTEVKSISDTIAILTATGEKDIRNALTIHGSMCSWLIKESINAGLPMRGATAYGEFQNRDNIFVGKAIDEAAAWHEEGDWIGVHLTPSAEFVYKPLANDVWVPYNVPLKRKLSSKTRCVDWTSAWKDRDQETKGVKKKFLQLGPILPEIAGKFINTLSFIEAMGENDSNSVTQPT